MSDSFWASEVEEVRYNYAAETNHRKPGEKLFDYLQRLVDVATGKAKPDREAA